MSQPSDLFTSRRWTHPWQVIRDFRDGSPVVVICSHRTERRASACAFWQDARALIGSGFAPRWYADIRRTPQRPARLPLWVITDDTLPKDTVIISSGVTADEILPGETPAEAITRLNRAAAIRNIDPK